MTGFKHGFARPGARSPEYRSWELAKSRCRNPHNHDYANYGGRGITFSPVWDRFESFLADMGPRRPGLTLDRIDGNGNYEPGNCQWADRQTQARHTAQNRIVVFQDERLLMVELAEQTGRPYQLLYDRIVRYGWTVERAVTAPVRPW